MHFIIALFDSVFRIIHVITNNYSRMVLRKMVCLEDINELACALKKVADLASKILSDVSYTNEIVTLLDMLVTESEDVIVIALLTAFQKVCLLNYETNHRIYMYYYE